MKREWVGRILKFDICLLVQMGLSEYQKTNIRYEDSQPTNIARYLSLLQSSILDTDESKKSVFIYKRWIFFLSLVLLSWWILADMWNSFSQTRWETASVILESQYSAPSNIARPFLNLNVRIIFKSACNSFDIPCRKDVNSKWSYYIAFPPP